MFAAEVRGKRVEAMPNEEAILGFRRMHTLPKFASVHASVHSHFPTERHVQYCDAYKQTRAAALAEWRGLLAA